jgi:hypothetical protein
MGAVQESEVGFRTVVKSAAITRPADTTQYAIGDVLAAVTSNDYFVIGTDSERDERGRITRRNRLTGTINAIVMHSSANQSTKPGIRLFIFDRAVTKVADNAAFAPTDAEMLTLICTVDLPADRWLAGNVTSGAGGNSFCQALNVDVPFRCAGGVLHIAAVLLNAYTPISGERFDITLTATPD